ncbi:hypothetical protein ACQ4PT_027630 [Festuca glaucescens]
MAGSSSRRHGSSRGHGGLHVGHHSSSRGHGGPHAGHHGSSASCGGHPSGPSSTRRRSNPHGGFNRVPTRILDDATEPRHRVRTPVSPEQGRRLCREYAEAPAHHGSSASCGGHPNGPSSTRRRSNPHGGFSRVPTRIPNDATEPRHRVRTPVSPEQGRRLFREYAEAPAGAKLPDGWHLNPNQVPIPAPPTGFTRDWVIAKRRRLARPELAADPRYAQDSPGWDEVFDLEHELHRRSFICPGSPPEWFTRESVSPPGSDDRDMAREDFYVRRPEEIFASNPLFPGPTPPRDPALPRPTIINGGRPHLHRLGAGVHAIVSAEQGRSLKFPCNVV